MGREKHTAPEGVPGPAWEAMARMMAAFSEERETMIMSSFSSARETPKNFCASLLVPLACNTVPPEAPAARATCITSSM